MTLDTSSYAVTVATSLNGGGGLTKTGSGTLTLSQSNGYTGGTTVSQGTLVLSAGAWTLEAGGDSGGGAVTVGNGATLTANNSVANKAQRPDPQRRHRECRGQLATATGETTI